jgi:hypothetical protein
MEVSTDDDGRAEVILFSIEITSLACVGFLHPTLAPMSDLCTVRYMLTGLVRLQISTALSPVRQLSREEHNTFLVLSIMLTRSSFLLRLGDDHGEANRRTQNVR